MQAVLSRLIKITSTGGNDEEKDDNPKGMNPEQSKLPDIVRPVEGGSSAKGPTAATDAAPPSPGNVVRLPKVPVDPEGNPAIAMMHPPQAQPDPALKKAKNEKAEKIKKVEDFLKSLKVDKVFREAANHGGYFGRAHIFLQFGDEASDEELKKPVGDGTDKVSRLKCTPKNPLTGIRAIEPMWAYPQEFNVSDPLDPNWYKPASWLVMSKMVHASRFLTIIPRPVPDMMKPVYAFGGLPLIQMARPYVDNWLKTRDSVSKIISNFSVFVLKTAMTESMDIDGSKLIARLKIVFGLRDNSGVLAIDKERLARWSGHPTCRLGQDHGRAACCRRCRIRWRAEF